MPITDRREKELADLGFVPLVHCKGTDYAAFFSVQSCQKPKIYDTDSANANARLSTQLPYIMAVSRFAHYLKAMMRDKIGSFMSREEAESFLNRWITNYVTPDDSASPATKAERPLREARIDVSEVPGKPGVYRAVAFLRPHFQLDELQFRSGWWPSCRPRRSRRDGSLWRSAGGSPSVVLSCYVVSNGFEGERNGSKCISDHRWSSRSQHQQDGRHRYSLV